MLLEISGNERELFKHAQRGARLTVGFDIRKFGKLFQGEFNMVDAGILHPAPERGVDLPDRFQRRIVHVNEKLLDITVGIGKKQNTFRLFPVSSGASGLLIIGFYGAGELIVDHLADILAVDPHAESIGGGKDGVGIVHKTALGLIAFGIAHTGMISDDAGELLSQIVHSLPGGGVNNGGHLFFKLLLYDAELFSFS